MAVLDIDSARLLSASRTPTAPPLSAGVAGFAAPATGLLAAPNAGQVIVSAPTGGQGLALTEAQRLPVTAPATALVPLAADPADVIDGQIWIRSDTNEIRFRDQGITYKIAGTAA